ncbi:hypothetical protein JRQ81_013296 [Phrynocephalus forsythii]|uniref:SGNH hydrolase-type esterase domain-containing protein n=1 Tax=Phrynocephalus forsythii TaxID=171643 RepID=A0A9Q1B4M0_9SAUR|nr:hypothetical protein JRQ81_013296 [Phrynocephalus forsythii]
MEVKCLPRIYMQCGQIRLDIIFVLVLITGPAEEVCIVGHSIVHWAGNWAARSPAGEHLGLAQAAEISWLGKRGMRWNQLRPTIWRRIRVQGPPNALILQLGENDLTEQKAVDLILSMKASLEFLHDSFPDMAILWSDLLQRSSWRGTRSPRGGGEGPQESHHSHWETSAARGPTISHHISFRNEDLFRADGVHLSNAGTERWLVSIKAAIGKWLEPGRS